MFLIYVLLFLGSIVFPPLAIIFVALLATQAVAAQKRRARARHQAHLVGIVRRGRAFL